MTAEYSPALIFAALLALLLEWLPGVSAWWQGLTPARRTTLNAFGVALISIVVMLLSCYRGNECPADVWGAVGDFLLVALLSLGVNQGVHLATKRTIFQS